MPENRYVVDITIENAQQTLIDGSVQHPVLVMFGVQMDESCQAMRAILDKLAAELASQLSIGYVDCEQQQALAGQMGVRSVPTLALFVQGRPVDGLGGPQTEQSLREMLERHLPKADDLLLAEAERALIEDDLATAQAKLLEAQQLSPRRSEILLGLARIALMQNRAEDAERQLSLVALEDQNSDFQALVSQLELAQQAADTPEIQALEAELAQTPDNHTLQLKLAVQYSQAGRNSEALAMLFSILQKDLGFGEGEARKTFLDILATMEKTDPVVSEYRRKLYSLMY